MKKQEVSFKSDTLSLYGELYFPDKMGHSPKTLIICHGIPAVPHNPSERGYAILAEKFCDNGFATLIFNFRGAGKSQGNFDLMGWTEDLKSAIDFLYSIAELKKSRLSLLGFSGGAAVSICVAADDPRVSAVVTLACPAAFDFLQPGKAHELIAYFRKIGIIRDADFPPSREDWLERFAAVSPLNCIPRVSPRPLLLIHGDQDNTVPLDNARTLYEQAKEPKELVIIPGAGHRLRLEEKAVAIALNWLKTKNG